MMNNLIIHRGPDEDGFVTIEQQDFSVGMAMRRLSIIDLSSGKQPIYSEDKKIVIVFNGEIYNFLTLKADLETSGVKFNTTSDTEVILKLYEKYGVEAFKKLDGMYGFSIYDQNINKLFIARDFFGEKPLYYTHTNEQFLWASELKYKACVLETGIRQKEAVAFYKKNGYQIIPNYGQYADMDNSLCFKKLI